MKIYGKLASEARMDHTFAKTEARMDHRICEDPHEHLQVAWVTLDQSSHGPPNYLMKTYNLHEKHWIIIIILLYLDRIFLLH